jgi:hypothetical protein
LRRKINPKATNIIASNNTLEGGRNIGDLVDSRTNRTGNVSGDTSNVSKPKAAKGLRFMAAYTRTLIIGFNSLPGRLRQ